MSLKRDNGLAVVLIAIGVLMLLGVFEPVNYFIKSG